MEKYLDMLLDFASANSFLFLYLVTGVINILMRFRTTEEWILFCEENPKASFFIRTIRAIGLDPVKVINSAVDMLNNKVAKK